MFGISNFELVSYFDIRISNFEAKPCRSVYNTILPQTSFLMLDTNHPQPPQSGSHWGTVAVIAIGAVLIVVWVSYLRPHMQLDEALHQAGVGQPLPMLELQPLTGTTEGVSLESLHGKVALINYWGPWCGFCVEEFPHLVELWDKNRGNPEFAFVSVSSAGR